MLTTKEYVNLHSKYPGPKNKYVGWKKDLEQIKEFNKALIEKYPWVVPTNDWSGKKITDCTGPDGEKGFWPGAPEQHPEYDYEYTLLDDMPDGWRIAFGDEMVERIHQELVRHDYVDKYHVVQIKEKFGTLRWYDNGTPRGKLSEDYEDIDYTPQGHWSKKFPDIDRSQYYIVEDRDPDHYISWTERGNMTEEEWEKYNLKAVYHYRIYTYLDKCRVQDIIDEYEQKSATTCIRCGEPARYSTKGWISPYCRKCAEEILDTQYQSRLKYAKEHNKSTDDIKRGTLESDFFRLDKEN